MTAFILVHLNELSLGTEAKGVAFGTGGKPGMGAAPSPAPNAAT